jgi:hypothetical protein
MIDSVNEVLALTIRAIPTGKPLVLTMVPGGTLLWYSQTKQGLALYTVTDVFAVTKARPRELRDMRPATALRVVSLLRSVKLVSDRVVQHFRVVQQEAEMRDHADDLERSLERLGLQPSAAQRRKIQEVRK